ncbi:CD1247 N-terminal domain-containing protein [Chakrabartyella piscis]|uniref:CD1247 N-terminal domain-containing protein n=1 Tax=Chakrabartyella piscis TaxID=2918914 RepID=UPI002958C6BB|nr:CD1247 N-terminal domain-containing protein [Chakrabartyella piscis]
MEYFEKKLTYLRGLCDGSGFSEDSKEGKVFHGILEVLDDMAFMLETFMDDDEDYMDMDIDLDAYGDEMDDDEPIFFHVCICPKCGEELDVDEETFSAKESIACPTCGEAVPTQPEEK